MRKMMLAAGFLILAAGLRAEITKEALLRHMSEANGYPPGVELSAGDSKPSELKGFRVMEVKLEFQGMVQSQPVYLSDDGKHYFLGVVRDATTDPDAERWSKIKLEGAPFKGAAKPKVTVAEFSDFQCPHCRNAFFRVVKPLLEEYPDRVRFVFKHFPLTNMHPWAEGASVAAECARSQKMEAFWNMHDSFFIHQASVTVQNLRDKSLEFARGAGLNGPQIKAFTSCFDKKETLKTVQAGEAEAEAAGINSAPTFLVQGHPVSGGNYQAVKALIEEFLTGKHAR